MVAGAAKCPHVNAIDQILRRRVGADAVEIATGDPVGRSGDGRHKRWGTVAGHGPVPGGGEKNHVIYPKWT